MSIIVLIGPSGSGKDTIGYKLAKMGIPQLVSFTTRDMRPGEVHGEDYYFVDEEQLKILDIVEQTEYSGNKYGLLKSEVDKSLEKNKNVYFIANADGARQIQRMYPGEVVPFWLEADAKLMRIRMYNRGDSEENIQERISHAMDNGELEEPKGIRELKVLIANNTPEDLVRLVIYTLKRRGFYE